LPAAGVKEISHEADAPPIVLVGFVDGDEAGQLIGLISSADGPDAGVVPVFAQFFADEGEIIGLDGADEHQIPIAGNCRLLSIVKDARDISRRMKHAFENQIVLDGPVEEQVRLVADYGNLPHRFQ
jgi:hypothetical protein